MKKRKLLLIGALLVAVYYSPLLFWYCTREAFISPNGKYKVYFAPKFTRPLYYGNAIGYYGDDNGETGTYIVSYGKSIHWSPDSKCIAVGGGRTKPMLSIFRLKPSYYFQELYFDKYPKFKWNDSKSFILSGYKKENGRMTKFSNLYRIKKSKDSFGPFEMAFNYKGQ